MSVGDTPITVVGNLTDDPELRFTASGVAMVRFTVASTPRTWDRTSGQWTDGTALFLRCTAWRELADHAAESLAKGARVIVTGRLVQHNWQTDQGENRSMLAVDVDDIGPSLRFATAHTTKATRAGAPAAAHGDPWSAGSAVGGHASDPAGDEPPF